MPKIDDGGPAFPRHSTGAYGMSLRDYFAIRVPEPTKDEIDQQFRNDQTANPHGDTYKQKRRSRLEIISDLRYAYADAMITGRKQK